MKKILASFLVVFLTCWSLPVRAAYPTTVRTVSPNVWTSNLTGALAASNETGLPVFLAVFGNYCSHCENFLEKTLSSSEWANVYATVPAYYVFILYYADGYSADDKWWDFYLGTSYQGIGFPVVEVINRNGKITNLWARRSSEYVNLSSEISAALQAANESTESYTPSNSDTDTESAKSGESETAAEKVAFSPREYKGKYTGLVFDMSGRCVSELTASIAASGKVTTRAKISGRRLNIKSTMTAEDGVVVIADSDMVLRLELNSDTGLWTGTMNDCSVIMRKKSAPTAYVGTYTFGCKDSSDVEVGYLTAKLAASGKVKIAGKISSGVTLKGSATGIVISKSEAEAVLPNLALSSDSVVAYSGTSEGGIVVLGADGVATANFPVSGNLYTGTGAKWNAPSSLSVLQGYSLRVSYGFSLEIASVSGKKVTFVENENKAKISFNLKTGIFKGNFVDNGTKYKYEGVMHVDANQLTGSGTVTRNGNYSVSLKK